MKVASEHIIVSPQISVLRLPNFVTTCFMIQSLNISPSIMFSIKQHNDMAIILWNVISLGCIVGECLHGNFAIIWSTENMSLHVSNCGFNDIQNRHIFTTACIDEKFAVIFWCIHTNLATLTPLLSGLYWLLLWVSWFWLALIPTIFKSVLCHFSSICFNNFNFLSSLVPHLTSWQSASTNSPNCNIHIIIRYKYIIICNSVGIIIQTCINNLDQIKHPQFMIHQLLQCINIINIHQ